MKITLIYPGIARIGFASLGQGGMDCNWINLGLAYIGSCLKQHGHDVDLIDLRDMSGWEETTREIRARRPDITGIYWNTVNFPNSLRCAQIAKESGSCVIAGGPHASIAPDEVIATGYVDHVITGEGELSFPALVADLGKGIKREKVIQGQRVQDLDSLPFPNRDLYNIPKVTGPLSNFPYLDNGLIILTSRGCPFHCAFCQPLGEEMFGTAIRRRSVENVMREVRQIKEKYGVSYISFQDDTFTVRKDWVLELCKRMREERLNLQWSCQSRVDTLDEEMLTSLRRAGCVCLFFGFESGSQRILDFLNKGIRVEQSLRAARLCKKHGMLIFANYMLGVPTETEQDLELTLELIRKIRPEIGSPAFFVPIPGSRLYDYCRDQGILKISSYEEFCRNPSGEKIAGIDYALVGRYRELMVKASALWWQESWFALLAFKRWAHMARKGFFRQAVIEFLYSMPFFARILGLVRGRTARRITGLPARALTRQGRREIGRSLHERTAGAAYALSRMAGGWNFSAPKLIGIEGTNRCNLNCIMCARRYWDKDANPLGDMDLGLFRGRILPFLTYLQKVNLQCFGEPLMSENFFAMAQDCKRKGCRVAFTTNGVLLPKYAQRVVETGIDFMTISIDGIDSLPAIRNISVSDLAEALQGLRDAQEQSRADAPFVCVNFTLMKDNARELSGVIDLCRRFGIRDLNVARIVVHSRLLEGKSAVDDSALREPLAEAREKAKRLGIMLSLPDPVGNVRRCTQPWEVMYINWNGDVRPCCMSTINENNALILGNVRDHTLAELWNCRAMRQLRLSLMKNGRPNDFCLNCPIRNCSSGSYTRILANG